MREFSKGQRHWRTMTLILEVLNAQDFASETGPAEIMN
jgi:hypothetical protein